MKFSFFRKKTHAPEAFPALPLNVQIPVVQIGALRLLRDVHWYPPDSWRELEQFQPRIVAGTQQALRQFCEQVKARKLDVSYLDTAVYCLTSLGERPVTDRLRDELWDLFGVPLFELFVAGDGQVLARECEAHEGWHVNTAATDFLRLAGEAHLVIARKATAHQQFDAVGAGFGGDVTSERCPCGLPTPRVINLPTDELWPEEEDDQEVEPLYAAS